MSPNQDAEICIPVSYGTVDYDHSTKTVRFDWELQSGYRLSHAHVAVVPTRLTWFSPLCSHVGVLTQEVLFENTPDATCSSPDFPGTGDGTAYVYVWLYYSRASETIVEDPDGGGGGDGDLRTSAPKKKKKKAVRRE